MNAPILGNGAYIIGTRFALDRYVTKEKTEGKKTEITYTHWRLLEVIEHERRYSYEIVCAHTRPEPLVAELIAYHTCRDYDTKTLTDLADVIADIILKCNTAINQIEQKINESNEQDG